MGYDPVRNTVDGKPQHTLADSVREAEQVGQALREEARQVVAGTTQAGDLSGAASPRATTQEVQPSLPGVPERPHPPVEPLLQFFAYQHLPERLQQVSQPFHDLALALVMELPRNPERTVCLRWLLLAKDAAVRTALYEE